MGTRVEQLKGAATANRHRRDEAKASNAQNTSQGAVLDSLLKLKATGQIRGFHVRIVRF
jgi:structural maintenance of chromosome 4